MNRNGLRAILSLLLGMIVMSGAACAQGELAPDKADKTLRDLQWRCALVSLCPYSAEVWETFRQAVAGKPGDQYLLGIFLMTGDKVGRDERGGQQWIGLAATQGYARAALELNREHHNGAEIEVDETRIAAAMRTRADAGDAGAMRALSEMYLDGRGVDRDPGEAMRLLRRAAETGSSEAEQDFAHLLLGGAPGVPPDRAQALRWQESAARHGNTEAMRILSYWLMHPPSSPDRKPIEAYRWLMRAALLNDPDAQEKLSQIFLNGMDDEGNTVKTTQAQTSPSTDISKKAEQAAKQVIDQLKAAPGTTPEMRERFNSMLQRPPTPAVLIAPDLVQADKWFRLAARDPWHDNPAIRATIEPHMTTVQLEEARGQVANWRPLPLPEVLVLDIAPATAPAGPTKR